MPVIHSVRNAGLLADELERLTIESISQTVLRVRLKESSSAGTQTSSTYLNPDQVREQIAALTEWLAKADAAEAERAAAHFA